jgi:hypothetical protein
MEGEEVGTTNGSGAHGDDCIAGFEDGWIWKLVDTDVAGRPEYDGLHGAGCSISTRYPSG